MRGKDHGRGPCTIEGCDRWAWARGWCHAHYHRWKKYGDPSGARPSRAEWFWTRVDKSGPNGCWVWLGTKDGSKGYGRLRGTSSHRYAYEALRGPVPDGLQLDHLCRNRICCNPDHLEPVTARENWIRGFAPSAIAIKQGACLRGHPRNAENTYVRPDGNNVCRVCVRLNYAKRQAAKKDAG